MCVKRNVSSSFLSTLHWNYIKHGLLYNMVNSLAACPGTNYDSVQKPPKCLLDMRPADTCEMTSQTNTGHEFANMIMKSIDDQLINSSGSIVNHRGDSWVVHSWSVLVVPLTLADTHLLDVQVPA